MRNDILNEDSPIQLAKISAGTSYYIYEGNNIRSCHAIKMDKIDGENIDNVYMYSSSDEMKSTRETINSKLAMPVTSFDFRSYFKTNLFEFAQVKKRWAKTILNLSHTIFHKPFST